MNIEQIRHFSSQIKALAKKNGIAQVYVFGSSARGEANLKSDVDLLVEMKEGASLFGMAGFGYEAEKLLRVPVDVVPSSLLDASDDKDFSKNIKRDAVAL